MEKLTIKLPLITLNPYINAERSNRFAGASLKKKHTKTCDKATRQAIQDGLSVEIPLKIKFDWYMKDKRQDLDNIAFQKKFTLDGMVKAGLIENDGYKQVRAFEDNYYIDTNERVEMTFFKMGDKDE